MQRWDVMVRIPSADSQTKEGMREYVDRTFEQVGLDVEVVMVMKYNPGGIQDTMEVK